MSTGSMKVIKRRIKSVESTMQITKAMQLVASSKLRRAKERADMARPYFTALYETMCDIQAENPGFLSPFKGAKENGRTLLVIIAGDRGLAGGFNSAIFKYADARIQELGGADQVEIMTVGKKACDYYIKRRYTMFAAYSNVAEHIKIHDTAAYADDIVAAYTHGRFKAVEMFYTNYVSPITQTAASLPLLPVDIPTDERRLKEIPVYEPSAAAVFDHIVPRFVSGMLYGAVIDSFASEQAARRNAMENASDNAEVMIDELSLSYNRARQAAITQEITEIVGGSQQ